MNVASLTPIEKPKTDYRFTVNPSELRRLGLCGSDAMLYSALKALCHKTGRWRIDYVFLADFACVGDRSTAYRSVMKLSKKGLVHIQPTDGQKYVTLAESAVQNAQSAVQNAQTAVQNAQNSVQNAQTTPYYTNHNNHNNHKGGGVKGTTTGTTPFFQKNPSFSEWWQLYTGGNQWQGLRLQTEKEWNSLSDPEKMQAMRHTAVFAPKNMQKKTPKQPNWYLLDRNWDEPITQACETHFLTGMEQDECRKSGVKMVQVRLSDGTFRIMRREEAERCRIEITVQDW